MLEPQSTGPAATGARPAEAAGSVAGAWGRLPGSSRQPARHGFPWRSVFRRKSRTQPPGRGSSDTLGGGRDPHSWGGGRTPVRPPGGGLALVNHSGKHQDRHSRSRNSTRRAAHPHTAPSPRGRTGNPGCSQRTRPQPGRLRARPALGPPGSSCGFGTPTAHRRPTRTPAPRRARPDRGH